jgi:carboxylesterase type B
MTMSGHVDPSKANVYDGTNLVSYGSVVLVTINYQLGCFNVSNDTLKDALLALHWIQDNIEVFGGDLCSSFFPPVHQTQPTKVLIYGESAGGR